MPPAAAAVAADMHCLDARLASFAAIKGSVRPKRAAKAAFPLDAATYPNLTPENLARAGFYHYPGKGADSADTCRCFSCDLELGGWDADDNPHTEHLKRDGSCAWKQVVCAIELDAAEGGPGRLRKTFPDADALPSSQRNTDFRQRTFGDWWPHAKPSPEELARAGFISVPARGAPDGTECPLCKYEVVEWEADDDPMEIHRRKQPECPFFTATVEDGKKTKGKRAPAKSKAKVVPESEEDELDDDAPPPQPKRAPAKSKARVVPESEGETESEQVAPPVPPKSKGRPKASTAPAAEDKEGSEPAKPKRGRKPKASAAVSAVPEAEEEAEAESQPKRRGRPKKASTAVTESAEASQPKRAGRAKASVATAAAEDAVADATEDETLASAEASQPKRRGPGRPPKASTAASTAASAATDEPAEEESQPKRRGPGRPRKASTAEPKKAGKKRQTAAEKRAAEAAQAAAAETSQADDGDGVDSELDLPENTEEPMSLETLESGPPPAPAPAPERQTRSRSNSKLSATGDAEPRKTKPLPRKGRTGKAKAGGDDAAPTPPPKPTPTAPLSVLERFENVPPPPPPRVKGDGVEQGTPPPSAPAPTILHAVADLVGSPRPRVPLSAQDKSLTLEDFVRREYDRRHAELRAAGEESIARWEAAARAERERLERLP